jgi:hypothetical protein
MEIHQRRSKQTTLLKEGKMNSQDKQVGLNEPKPDKLSFAILLIGILGVCVAANPYLLILFIFYRTLPPTALPFFLLGGIGIAYGIFKTARGTERTRQYVKTMLRYFGVGAIAGLATGIVVYVITFASLQAGFENNCLLSDVIGAMNIFGIASGGIGGLIFGTRWKNKRAAFIGGVFAVVVLAVTVFASFHSVPCVNVETISP